MRKHCAMGSRVFSPTDDERSKLCDHADLGGQILAGGQSPLIEMARSIAMTHHEKWDGSGYPHGLAGEDIPLVGRITAVADVFDALSSSRPYKPAFSLEKSFEIMKAGDGTQFDPRVLQAFLDARETIVQTRLSFPDVA